MSKRKETPATASFGKDSRRSREESSVPACCRSRSCWPLGVWPGPGDVLRAKERHFIERSGERMSLNLQFLQAGAALPAFFRWHITIRLPRG